MPATLCTFALAEPILCCTNNIDGRKGRGKYPRTSSQNVLHLQRIWCPKRNFRSIGFSGKKHFWPILALFFLWQQSSPPLSLSLSFFLPCVLHLHSRIPPPNSSDFCLLSRHFASPPPPPPPPSSSLLKVFVAKNNLHILYVKRGQRNKKVREAEEVPPVPDKRSKPKHSTHL